MSMRFKIVGVVMGAALMVAAALGALVYVQPVAAAAINSVASANTANGGGGGICGQVGLDATAKALNMTSADLQTQLRGGSTLTDLATKANVKLADVLAAVDAACKVQTKTAIEAAVTAGTLTRAKADWLEQGLAQGYWGPGATDDKFGFGGGFGGFGGPHGFGGPRGFDPGGRNNPNATPQASPSSTATP